MKIFLCSKNKYLPLISVFLLALAMIFPQNVQALRMTLDDLSVGIGVEVDVVDIDADGVVSYNGSLEGAAALGQST